MISDRQWHVERSKQVLLAHPEIKQYFGPYPLSIIPIIGLIALQWSMAWLVKDLPWWIIGLISLLIGQFVLHSLSTFLHEAAHRLIFKGKLGNAFSLFLIELGTLSLGKSLTYISRHGKSHHRYLNEYSRDYEWWDKRQAQFRTSKFYWRLAESFMHLLPGGVIVADLITDTVCSAESRPIESAHQPVPLKFLLICESLLLYGGAWYFISWKASLYLFWSVTLMVSYWGVTFKGQSIAEHHVFQTFKTFSTYQWTNIPFFNTGYHDEHHTFVNVPWVHLPKIKKIAPEYFTNDNPYSYFYLWWRWAKSIFEPVYFNRYILEVNPEEELTSINKSEDYLGS